MADASGPLERWWRVLTNDFRGRPRHLTAIVKAVQALQYLIRDAFGTAGIDTAS